jgi:tRNA dimethylallyltransferase
MSGAVFDLPLKEKLPPHVKKKKVIVIAGPTSIGKTKRSLIIAHALGGEIVSADSMQVYRGMDIGTAKVSLEDRQRIPHHLIDVKALSERFNVVDFYHAATQAIHEILAKDHVPVVVGGTGFYIHCLIYGPPQGPPSVQDMRQRLEGEMEKYGTEAMYWKLQQLDPDYARTITQNDKQKIVRALEIMALTQQKVSHIPVSMEKREEYDFRCWFLYAPKAILYPKIDLRCDEMVAQGLIQEVRDLEEKGLRLNRSAAQAIGYRQALEYLESAQTPQDFEKFVVRFKQASRHYAKRQFTWFRPDKEPLFRWLNVDEHSLENSVEIIIQDYEQSF